MGVGKADRKQNYTQSEASLREMDSFMTSNFQKR